MGQPEIIPQGPACRLKRVIENDRYSSVLLRKQLHDPIAVSCVRSPLYLKCGSTIAHTAQCATLIAPYAG